jgi:hypothetical protein
MRRIFVLLSVLAAAGSLGLSGPAEGGEGSATLTITKVVQGDGPTGGFVINYDCDSTDGGGGSLTFDLAGPGLNESQSVQVDSFSTCTVTEIDSNGADSVSYACTFTPFPPAITEGRGACVDDQTVVFSSSESSATITVTNRFDSDVLSDDGRPDGSNDPAVGTGGVASGGVVAASPAFTG